MKKLASCLVLVIFTSIILGVGIVYAKDLRLRNTCEQNHISYDLVIATSKYSDSISVDEIVEKFTYYCSLAGTEDEVDIADALVEILGCSFDDALHILSVSDEAQLN